MSKIWRCPECETMNQDEKCVVCGYVNREYNKTITSTPSGGNSGGTITPPPPPIPPKKKTLPIVVCTISACIVVICIGVLYNYKSNDVPANSVNNSGSIDSIQNVSEAEEKLDTTEITANEITANENTEQEQYYGVLEYHSNGNVLCEKSKLDDNGNYTLMWYDPNGMGDKLEYYNSENVLYKVDTSISGKWYESELELTENGYIITVADVNTSYPYMKYVIDFSKGRSGYKYIYCDENKNELFWRSCEQEYYSDGSHKTWFKEPNGELHQIQNHNPDGSKSVEMYENNVLSKIVDYDEHGEKIRIVSYDESRNIKQIRKYMRDGSYEVDFYKNGSVTKTQKYDKDGNRID